MTMLSEERVSFWERIVNRREFLKQSGRGVAGITVSMTVVGLLVGSIG